MEQQPDQWQQLREIIEEQNLKKIALNYSQTFALADSITYSEHQAFTSALPQKYEQRIVSGEELAIGWLETRTKPEMRVYPMICQIGHNIIKEGCSEKVNRVLLQHQK
jgi:hypothetical protein